MPLARCASCAPKGLRQNYTHLHKPVDEKRLLCGVPTCTSYALIWLTDEEERQYTNGLRLFRLRSIETQVR